MLYILRKEIKMDKNDQMVLLKIKSLLNHLRYFIKDEHMKWVDEFYELCRKYASWGNTNDS